LYNSLPEKIAKLKQGLGSPQDRSLLYEEIQSIENKEQEKEYLSKTANIIEEYQRIKENENNDASSGSNFYQKDTNGKITKYVEIFNHVEKERLCEEYCKILNNGKMINSKKLVFSNKQCSEEGCNGETTTIESFVTCIECGCVQENSIMDFQISYKDLCDTLIKTNFSYKRINRFNEILSTLQAKETIDIPEYVLASVKKEIVKEGTNLNVLTVKKIKNYLKRSSLTNYYEHAPYILSSINGKRTLQLSVEVEDKLRDMFKEIQDPYEVAKNIVVPKRKSFLNYHYVIYKFAELLSLDSFKQHFTLLKSNEKLRTQDKIWKEICKILDWKFVPTKNT